MSLFCRDIAQYGLAKADEYQMQFPSDFELENVTIASIDPAREDILFPIGSSKIIFPRRRPPQSSNAP